MDGPAVKSTRSCHGTTPPERPRLVAYDELGEMATRSAVINQRYLPQPHFDSLLELSQSTNAFGLQVAHSGRMVGMFLDPRLEKEDKSVEHIQRELLRLNLFSEFFRSGQTSV
jgi:uncharacterized protein involved in propanediol utilization